MSSSYQRNAVPVTATDVVLLKYVESIHFPNGAEDLTADKLKDDITFIIKTCGGKEYEVSAKLVIQVTGYLAFKPADLVRHIYDRWLYIAQEK